MRAKPPIWSIWASLATAATACCSDKAGAQGFEAAAKVELQVNHIARHGAKVGAAQIRHERPGHQCDAGSDSGMGEPVWHGPLL